MTQTIEWGAIAAPLCLLAGAVAALLGDTFAPSRGRVLAPILSLAGLVGALLSCWAVSDRTRAAFCLPAGLEAPLDCSWVVDHVSLVWWLIMIGSTVVVLLLLTPAFGRAELPAGETCFLLLASATGALCVAASRDLITLVVSMETVSLPAFALVGLRRHRGQGSEAALKFFIASVVATAFTLLGISMVYGATGSVTAGGVATSVATGAAITPVIGAGMVLTLVGLAFKVAAVPFQVWVPDTYVGGPIPVAAYLSVVSKSAGLAGIAVVLVRFFPTYFDTWSPVIGIAAALTMTVGNLAALQQRHAVRLLAWSSVAQAGYLLVPLAAGGDASDLGALQVYVAMYAFVNLLAFAVVAAGAEVWGAVDIGDFAGLLRSSPLLGGGLAFALLCLAGLPPGVIGLLAKVVIFQSAVEGGVTWLAVVMAVNVAIGLLYYLRFLVVLLAPAAERSQSAPRAVTNGPASGQEVPSERSQSALKAVAGTPSGDRAGSAQPASVGPAAVADVGQTSEPGGASAADSGEDRRLNAPATTDLVVTVTLLISIVLSVWPAPLFSILP